MDFGLFGREQRATASTLENPSVSLNDPVAFAEMFAARESITGESVTAETAMQVSAVWQAVNCIAGTIAQLPLHLYTSDSGGHVTKKTKDALYRVVHDKANDIHTAYAFWKWVVIGLLVDGRALSLIVRDRSQRVVAFLPLKLSEVTIKQKVRGAKLERTYAHDGIIYQSSDILDFALSLKSDGVSHYNPIEQNRNTIALIVAAEKFSATLFANGGVPPLTLTGPAMSPTAAARANNDIEEQLRGNRSRQRKVLPIPTGFELKPIGIDPSKQQLIELRRWLISEVSRIFNLAPAMLHDLTSGTYSNFEQQSLNFAKMTIAPLTELIEQEMNSKLFGARNTSDYVEFNLDGLQRGDFLSRMDGSAKAVQAGIRTPNEIRALDNLPPLEGGDKLFIQGAMVPIEDAGKHVAPVTAPPADPPE